MEAHTRVTRVREKGATALLNGGGGFGQVAEVRGMEEAIRRAEKYGVGSVGVQRLVTTRCFSEVKREKYEKTFTNN